MSVINQRIIFALVTTGLRYMRNESWLLRGLECPNKNNDTSPHGASGGFSLKVEIKGRKLFLKKTKFSYSF